MTAGANARSAARERVDSNWFGILLGVALAALAAFHQFKLPPVLPVLLDAYRYPPTLAGGFMSVYALVGFALSLPLGPALQRRGALPFIYAALGLLLAGSVLVVAAPGNAALVLAARAAEGAGFAVLAIAGPALVNVNAAPRHAALAAGLVATWIPLGQIGAGLVARPALAAGHWQALWWTAALLSLVMALVLRGAVRAGRVDLTPRGLGTLPAGAPELASHGFTPLQRAALWLGGLLFMLWGSQYHAAGTWLPEFLVARHGLSPADAAWAYLAPMAMVLVFNIVAGWLLRHGVRLSVLLGVVLAAQAALWGVMPRIEDPVTGALALLAWGIAGGLTPTCFFALPALVLGPQAAGPRAFAIIMFGRNLGVLVGPVLLAAVLTVSGGWALVGPIFAAISAAALAASLGLGVVLRRLARDGADPSAAG